MTTNYQRTTTTWATVIIILSIVSGLVIAYKGGVHDGQAIEQQAACEDYSKALRQCYAYIETGNPRAYDNLNLSGWNFTPKNLSLNG